MDSQWYELLTPGITLNRATGEDSFGNKTYASGVSISGAIRPVNFSVGSGENRYRESNDISVSVRITTDYISPPIAVRDRMTLPHGETLFVRDVETHYDETGPHHVVISLSTEDEQ